MANYTVKQGTNGITSEALVDKGNNNVTMCTGLAWLTLPVGFLAEITAECDILNGLDEEVLFHGGKITFEAKRSSEVRLRKLIKKLAAFVQAQCGGELDKILAAGFEARSKGNPVVKLDRPEDLQAIFTNTPGTVDLRWKKVKNAINYKVYLNAGDPLKEDEWILVGYTSKARYTVDELVSAHYCNFRVQAQGRKGLKSIMSQVVRGLAA